MGRWTKANKTTRTPSVYVTLKTMPRADSVPGVRNRVIHRFRLGHASLFRWDRGRMTRRKWVDFTEPIYWWDWLVCQLSPERPVVVYAHNMARELTMLKAWEMIEDGALSIRRFVDTDPPFILRCQHERGRVDFLDSLNWFQSSISDIASDVGMARSDVDLSTADDRELLQHCRQDCAILEKRIWTLVNWIRENDLGVMQRTAPGQAMQAYKHRFGPRTTIEKEGKGNDGISRKVKVSVCYPLLHESPGISRLERLAYFGGEARVFRVCEVIDPTALETVARVSGKRLDSRLVEGPIYHLDVNSLYPYVMRANKYPGKFLQRIDGLEPCGLKAATNRYEVIAHVRLNTPSESFPTRYEDKTIYAVGKFWTDLCANELRYALEKGYVTECEYALLYEPIDLFSKYVDFFYDLKLKYKEEDNRSGLSLCKMMLVSLQAKWGAKSFKWIDIPGIAPAKPWGMWPEPDEETGETIWCRGIGSHKQIRGKDGEGKDSFVSIPACVCSNGREYMRRIRQIAGDKSVYYQHTDSIHAGQVGFDNLKARGFVDDTKLGRLRIVEVVRYGAYRGVNDYDSNGRTIQAGLDHTKTYVREGSPRIDRLCGAAGIINSKPPDGVIVESQLVSPYVHNYGWRIDRQGYIHPVKLGG